MGKKILFNKNWLLFLAIHFFFIQIALGQTHGDYRSNGTGSSSNLAIWQIFDTTIMPSGNWRSAELADGLPGQNSGTYTVTISSGNIVTIVSDITSASTGPVHIFGELVIGDTTPRVIVWNSSLFIIENTGIVRFQDQKSVLKLPTSAVLTIKPGGSITGACSNKTEIYIGDDLIAVCVGGGGKVLTFNQLIAGGGSLDSEINQPISNAVFCANQDITLEGRYLGAPSGTVSYEWKIFDTNLSLVLTGFSGNKTGTFPTSSSLTSAATFKPSVSGVYYISFSVSDSNVTNVETHKITVDTTPPIAIAKDVIVQLNNLGAASVTAEQVNNGSSDNCGAVTLSVNPNTFSCSDAKPVLTDLIISEYVEGSNNNKYIEIYNGTGSDINLSNYRLRTYYNGASTPLNDEILSGILLSGSTIVYANSSANIYSGVTINNTAVNFNGDDAIELFKISTSTSVDIFGRIGEDPGSSWSISGLTTIAKTLRRKSTVLNGVTVNPSSGFPTLGTEWVSYNKDDVSGLGNHCLASVVLVELKVTDTAGNFSFDYANVFVVDELAPTWTTLATALNSTIQCSDAATLTTAQALAPVATDNCSAVTYTKTSGSFVAGSCGNAGTYTNTWVAKDPCLNTSTVFTQVITITDTTAPVITGTITPTNVEACSILAAPAAQTTVAGLEALLGNLAISDNCSSDANLTVTSSDVVSGACPIVITRTYTVKDQCNNTSASFTHIINIADTTPPTASNPAPIKESGTAPAPDTTVVTDEADNCTAIPTVTFISDTSAGTCPQIVTRIYRVTDNCGNYKDVTQLITVEEIIAPIARCKTNFTVQLSNVDGTATILPSDIDNVSTDNCGNVSLSVSPSSFTCANIGNNTVTLTVTDNYGNVATCTSTVIVEAPTINSGTLKGYTNLQLPADAKTVIELTSCPYDTTSDPPTPAKNVVYLNITDLGVFSDKIQRWEYSTNGGLTWTTITNSTSSQTLTNVSVSTLVRVVIKVGDCVQYSAPASIVVIPPNLKPTITSVTRTGACFADRINVTAQSSYGVNPNLNTGGTFNASNLNTLGWLVDGIAAWTANRNNQTTGSFGGTEGPKQFSGRCYDSPDKKFSIANGENKTFTLETPIFNTIGLTTASLEFDQAFNFTVGASATIVLSLNGGADGYPITLSSPTYNYTGHSYIGPSNTGFINSTKSGQCKDVLSSDVDKHVSINLNNFITLSGLRIKFVFNSNTTSSWALDNISIPQKPVNEVIQWTDLAGNVITTGSATSFAPNVPGIQEFGVTSLINSCRAFGDEGTSYVSIDVSLAYAGPDINPITNKCGENFVRLNAYDNTIDVNANIAKGIYPPPSGFAGVTNWGIPSGVPIDHDRNPLTPNRMPLNHIGTSMTGSWSINNSTVPCVTFTPIFSDTNSPNSTFTADPGTYTLRWTLTNGCFDDIVVIIDSCNQINFDGVDDYVTFRNNYNLNSAFSIEAWVKPNSINGTIFSRKDANENSKGYDLSLSAGSVVFNWYSAAGNGSISTTSNKIDTSRWYHIAVTYNGSNYKLYVDGIDLGIITGSVSAPDQTPANIESLLGAIAGSPPNNPVNYFNGWMDEFRVWNKALSVDHIRQMMNQEIKHFGTDDVMGEVVPVKINGPDSDNNGLDDDNPLTWSNLSGYYRMNVDCGYLTAYKGSDGRIRNTTTPQIQTAPIPYTSANDGTWDNAAIWTQPLVWNIPNGLGIDGTTRIDWNIVETSHNITANRDLTLLGLVSKEGELTIAATGTLDETNSGQMLWITHYLKLNGSIDLVGESQLLQKRYGTYDSAGLPVTSQLSESIFDEASIGFIERDQRGQGNLYNYDFRSSPVSIAGAGVKTTYAIKDVLFNGIDSENPKPINFIYSSLDGSITTDPIQISERWLYLNRSFDTWLQIPSTSNTIKTAEGFTLKGSFTRDDVNNYTYQNYVFKGKPHNGSFTTLQSGTNWDSYLVGNPYPSAMDANKFIDDNISTIQGAVYYYHDFGDDYSHITGKASYGYAMYSKLGGVEAYNRLPQNGPAKGGKSPQRYIPVAQGFWVYGLNGGPIKFNNNQRVYKTESGGESVLFRTTASKNKNQILKDQDLRTKIRIGFNAEGNLNRQILLTIDERTTDGIDNGFDAGTFKELPDVYDMYWVVSNQELAIQGVGDLTDKRVVPIGIKTKGKGLLKIKVDGIENPYPNMGVYLKDNSTHETFDILNGVFEIKLDDGEYNDKYSVVFKSSREENVENYLRIEDISVFVDRNNSVIKLIKPAGIIINKIDLFNMLGQHITGWESNLDANNINLNVKVNTGVYVLSIDTNYGNLVKKVLIDF